MQETLLNFVYFVIIPIALFVASYHLMYKRPDKQKQRDIEFIRKEINSKITSFVDNKTKAELAILVMLEKTDDESEIYGIFNNATFPEEVDEAIKECILKGAKFKILMRCNGQIERENANKLCKLGKKHKNVEIHNFDNPKPNYKNIRKDPGNVRMIINSKSLKNKDPLSIIGIEDPINKSYKGIIIKDNTFFNFMKASFIDQYDKYEKFQLIKR